MDITDFNELKELLTIFKFELVGSRNINCHCVNDLSDYDYMTTNKDCYNILVEMLHRYKVIHSIKTMNVRHSSEVTFYEHLNFHTEYLPIQKFIFDNKIIHLSLVDKLLPIYTQKEMHLKKCKK